MLSYFYQFCRRTVPLIYCRTAISAFCHLEIQDGNPLTRIGIVLKMILLSFAYWTILRGITV
jgi:hypothetical protein